MQKISATLLKQIVLLSLIVLLAVLIIWQLYYFIPGALVAITLYILFRNYFFKLTETKKWKKWTAALMLIMVSIVVFVLPIYGIVNLLIPKIKMVITHSDDIMASIKELEALIKRYVPDFSVSDEQIQSIVQASTKIVSSVLNATASVLFNILVAFFLLYFMFINGRSIEKSLVQTIHLKEDNQKLLWAETKNMVVSNAIGIPLLILAQSITAIIGYWIFGVKEAVFWGVITGAASIIPVVGCMVIWVPLAIIMFAAGDVGMAIGLTIYSAVVISNIDNVLRFTLLRKIGDVHPIITVFGVIMGLQIFGIMGLIFGPLLIAYLTLLIKIYKLEFKDSKTTAA